MRVAVIGAGAAGMIAAGRAAQRGHIVDVYEKNGFVGKKIRITGKGRCNMTNASDPEEHIANTPGNPYFMYSALYRFTPSDTVSLMESLGVATKVERGKRVFPVSDRAADVAEALLKYMKKNGARLHLEKTVRELTIKEGHITGLVLEDGKRIEADAVIVATGGLSFPKTGSTGDGYRFARAAGHRVTPLYPSLVPIRSDEPFCASLMGLSLKNCAIVIKNRYDEDMTLYIDMKPALDMKELDARLLKDFEKYINKDLKNALNDLLPQKMIPVIIEKSGIDENKKIHDITKEERRVLCGLIKGLPVRLTGSSGFDEAVVTSGGVDTDEIDPSTMESRLVKGLYFVGEVLDVDAYTGGFNLQIAFSTGYAAGESVGEE